MVIASNSRARYKKGVGGVGEWGGGEVARKQKRKDKEEL